MLKALSISNVVLIEHLDITFEKGFCALTGETGAGKSILLDALGLALGNRSSQSYIKKGAAKAVVSAEFIIKNNINLISIIKDHGLDNEDRIILRRIINKDGKTRSFINDHPVGVKFLQKIGQHLIEIHGQFDQLLESSSHREFLDSYAKSALLKESVYNSYKHWNKTEKLLLEAKENTVISEQNEDFLRYSLKEIDELNVKEGEESLLIEKRNQLLNSSKYKKALESALFSITKEESLSLKLCYAIRSIEKINDNNDQIILEILQTLDRANNEIIETISLLESKLYNKDNNYSSLEDIEDRLYKLRAISRKHNCLVEQLLEKRDKLQDEIDLIENSEKIIKDLSEKSEDYKKDFIEKSYKLSKKRKESANKLDKEVIKELPPLKLERARFETKITELPESLWSENGIDKVQFNIATNPGSIAGPLSDIASGGERSRFMLALKVVLANEGIVSSMIFDEIDSGVGGSVAHAIGERLSRLSNNFQILVVTHSPQVAAIAKTHINIEKHQGKSNTSIKTTVLNDINRREELARMISGDTITLQARAAANQLLLRKAS